MHDALRALDGIVLYSTEIAHQLMSKSRSALTIQN